MLNHPFAARVSAHNPSYSDWFRVIAVKNMTKTLFLSLCRVETYPADVGEPSTRRPDMTAKFQPKPRGHPKIPVGRGFYD
jgi:hypothetical protein